MLDHHTFGQPGGARRIDHVGQMVDGQVHDLRIVLTHGPVSAVQCHDRQRQRWKPLQQIGLSQHHDRRAVLQQVADTLVRVTRIDRHITGTGLEHCQQPDQCVQPAARHDRHAVVRTDAQPDQMMRECVGATVQFAVAQTLVTHLRGHGIRRHGCLLLDASVNGELAVRLAASGIEAVQQLDAFGSGQQIQRVEPTARRLRQALNQCFHGADHVGTDTSRINACRGERGQVEALAQIIDAQGQRVVAALIGLKQFDTLPGFAGRSVGSLRCCAVSVIEQSAEQRRTGGQRAATLRECQRSVFMRQQATQAAVGLQHSLLCGLASEVDAQRQGIDEHAQRALHTFTPLQSAKQNGAEHHLVATGQLSEYLSPGQVHQAGRTDTQHTRLITHLATQVSRHRLSGFTRHFSARQPALAIRQGRLVQIPQLLSEELFMALIALPLQGLGNVVAVRHRRGQLRFLIEQHRLQFVAQQLQRHVIHDQVMEQQHRDNPPIGRIGSVDQTQQRRPFKPKRLCVCESLQRDFDHGQRGLAPDHLHRCFQPFPAQRGPQHVVAGDHLLQGDTECVQTRTVSEGETGLQLIGIVAASRQVMVEDTGLQRPQRIDVLHVGHATRNTGDDKIDVGLFQCHQRQKIRGDAQATRLDQIGGHLCLLTVANRSRQCSQRRLREQRPNIRIEPLAAHLRDQVHGQQRMPAQFEEMVMTAHTFDVQQ